MGSLIQLENSALNTVLRFREEIKRQQICITDELNTPLGALLVSKLEWPVGWIRSEASHTKNILYRDVFDYFNPGGYEARLTVKKVQFVQPIKVSLSTPDQLLAAGEGEPAATLTHDIFLVFDLDVTTSTNEVFFVNRFAGIEGLPDLPGLQQTIQERVVSQFKPYIKTPLNVGKISGLGGQPGVANAGIAAVVKKSEDGTAYLPGESTIAIRIELGPYPTSTDAWEAFFSKPQENLFKAQGKNGFTPGDRGWVVFLAKYFMTQRVVNEVEQGLQKAKEFRLRGGIASTWGAPGGRSIVNLSFYATAVDVCAISSLDLRLQIPVEFLIKPDTFQQHIKVNYWKSDSDTAVCAAIASLVWPYVGVKLVEFEQMDWLGYIASLPFSTFVFLSVLNNINPQIPSTSKCQQTSKDEFLCTADFDMNDIPTEGRPHVMDSLGRDDGFVILGDVSWTEQLGRQFKLASIGKLQFKLETPSFGTCNGSSSTTLALINEHPENFLTYTATVTLTFKEEDLPPDNPTKPVSISKTNLIPPYVCSVRVRDEDDPLHVFRDHVAVVDSTSYYATIKVSLPVTSVPPEYFTTAHRYPCRLLIHTSAGTRMITLPPIEQANQGQMKSAATAAWAQRVSNCYAKSQRYNPKWIIDPNPLFRIRHLWEIIATRLEPGEKVILRTNRDLIVSSAVADRQGRAFLRTMLSPQAYDNRLQFVRDSGSSGPSGPIVRHHDLNSDTDSKDHPPKGDDFALIDAKQTQFLLRSDLRTGKPILGYAPFMLEDHPGLVLLDSSGVIAFDLSQPQQPTVLAQMALSCFSGRFSGITSMGNQIFVWGEAGILYLELDPEAGAFSVEQLFQEPVTSMASNGLQLFFLHQDYLEIWNRNRQHVMTVAAPQAFTLAATTRHLLIGTPNQIKVYDLGEADCLKAVGELRVDGLSRILAPTVLTGDDHFLVEGAARRGVIDATNPKSVLPVDNACDTEESYDILRYHDLLIHAAVDGMSLHVYSIGEKAFA
ncbi:hypothetical protein [Brevibacillus dissolubilis]|uniref:hypothetical protein n=1 Tax=Brevibacillus dissolubilis TaxID=1844116 RepID=UPI001117114F|nr:hypothetical protein [Brevibacillus dissolubilis]